MKSVRICFEVSRDQFAIPDEVDIGAVRLVQHRSPVIQDAVVGRAGLRCSVPRGNFHALAALLIPGHPATSR